MNEETRLPSEPAVAELGTSASPRTDSGTIARSEDDDVTGSPRESSQLRRAPETTVSTTSLTVHPWAARTVR
jgi:hypothetical protein